jgi:PhnB protein
MDLNPYLSFKGDMEQAVKLYEKVLGAKVEMMMPHEGSPMPAPPEWGKKIMHGSFTIDGQRIMGSDMPPDHYQKPAGITISIGLKSVEEAERIFKELSEGGTIQMQLEQTFWAKRFAMFTDRFGIPWMINCE